MAFQHPLCRRSDDPNLCVSQAWYSIRRALRKGRVNWLLLLGAHLACTIIRRGTSRKQGLFIKKIPKIKLKWKSQNTLVIRIFLNQKGEGMPRENVALLEVITII